MNDPDEPTSTETDMADNDEKQWEQHIRDEADALQDQQASAGPDVRPVPGPGLYGDHGTNIYVREAVLAERERCVRQAGLCATEAALREKLGAISARDRKVAQALVNAIVNAIRSDDAPE
jgi:hypothetical protein